MSTEPGVSVQTQYSSTQMLSDHRDKSVTEEQAICQNVSTAGHSGVLRNGPLLRYAK